MDKDRFLIQFDRGKSYKPLWGQWILVCILAFLLGAITRIPMLFASIPSLWLYRIAISQMRSGVALDGMANATYAKTERPFTFWANTIWILILATSFIAAGVAVTFFDTGTHPALRQIPTRF
jgi:hypothetical protein